ncbi:hypothetical protein Hanom_Chr14g01258601 [Helianthus anomalus]
MVHGPLSDSVLKHIRMKNKDLNTHVRNTHSLHLLFSSGDHHPSKSTADSKQNFDHNQVCSIALSAF